MWWAIYVHDPDRLHARLGRTLAPGSLYQCYRDDLAPLDRDALAQAGLTPCAIGADEPDLAALEWSRDARSFVARRSFPSAGMVAQALHLEPHTRAHALLAKGPRKWHWWDLKEVLGLILEFLAHR